MRRTQVVAVVLALVAMRGAFGQQERGAGQSQAGRQASAVTVEPLPTPPIPEGSTGIAARYPGDVGIEKDPDVVFVESFEGSVDEISSHWEAAAGKPIMTKSDEVPPGSGGKQSLLLTRVAGGSQGYMDGGNFYRRLKNDKGGYGYDQLFFRFYMKFNKEHAPFTTTEVGSSASTRRRPGPKEVQGSGRRARYDGPARSSRATSRPGTSTVTGRKWEGARQGAKPGEMLSSTACRPAPWSRTSGSVWKLWSK